MRSNLRWWVLMAAGAVLGVGAAQASPAGAHDSRRSYLSFTYIDSRQCLMSYAEQNHGAPVTPVARQVRTDSLGHINGTCNAPLAQTANKIAHRGWMYKAPWGGGAGTLCIQGGWQYNQSYTSFVEWGTHESLWASCNNPQTGTVITHDVEGAVWNPWDNRWITRQSRPLPTTWHDYCCGPNI